jgi:formylglycine-generating enzyme required for sulfatase activity
LQGLLPAYTISKNIIDVENVTKADKYRYLITINKTANGYRLPTSAEWECAARAGTTTIFNTGNTITPKQANYAGDLGIISVGSYKPNSWGIYDMHGNVWEWCWDWYIHGFGRIMRGGAWYSPASELRSASVTCGFQYINMNSVGFRLARNVYK